MTKLFKKSRNKTKKNDYVLKGCLVVLFAFFACALPFLTSESLEAQELHSTERGIVPPDGTSEGALEPQTTATGIVPLDQRLIIDFVIRGFSLAKKNEPSWMGKAVASAYAQQGAIGVLSVSLTRVQETTPGTFSVSSRLSFSADCFSAGTTGQDAACTLVYSSADIQKLLASSQPKARNPLLPHLIEKAFAQDATKSVVMKIGIEASATGNTASTSPVAANVGPLPTALLHGGAVVLKVQSVNGSRTLAFANTTTGAGALSTIAGGPTTTEVTDLELRKKLIAAANATVVAAAHPEAAAPVPVAAVSLPNAEYPAGRRVLDLKLFDDMPSARKELLASSLVTPAFAQEDEDDEEEEEEEKLKLQVRCFDPACQSCELKKEFSEGGDVKFIGSCTFKEKLVAFSFNSPRYTFEIDMSQWPATAVEVTPDQAADRGPKLITRAFAQSLFFAVPSKVKFERPKPKKEGEIPPTDRGEVVLPSPPPSPEVPGAPSIDARDARKVLLAAVAAKKEKFPEKTGGLSDRRIAGDICAACLSSKARGETPTANPSCTIAVDVTAQEVIAACTGQTVGAEEATSAAIEIMNAVGLAVQAGGPNQAIDTVLLTLKVIFPL